MMSFYSVRILRRLEEKLLAQRLLYQVYVEELGWIPPEGNPSNLTIQSSPMGNILTDDYDSVSIKVGGFYGEKLIGVHRRISRINGRLEVETYTSIPKFLHQECDYEFNRLAIEAEFRNSPILTLMVAAEFRYLIRHGCKYAISTATFPEPGNLFCKLGATKIDFPEFKYHVSDPYPVSLIVFFFEKQENFKQLFRIADKLKEKGKVKQVDQDIYV